MTGAPSSSGAVLTALWIYPIKGCRGVSVDRAWVGKAGLSGDRRWMVTDPEGQFLTLRTEPRLSQVRISPLGEGWRLESPGAGSVPLPREGSGEAIAVRVWDDDVRALNGPVEVRGWLEVVLKREIRIVYVADEDLRSLSPKRARPEDRVGFADGYPCLLTSTSSLESVNEGLSRPVPMERFRPNLVVDGPAAFEEDFWGSMTVGELAFEAVKPCIRCVVVDLDESSGRNEGGVLRRLAELRGKGNEVTFGQNLIPRGSGWIAAGDRIQLSE